MPTAAQIQARIDQLTKEGDAITAKIDELRRSGRKYPDPELCQLGLKQGKIIEELMNLTLHQLESI